MAESCLSCKRIVNNSGFSGPAPGRNRFPPVWGILGRTYLYIWLPSRHNPVKWLWREKEAQENEVWNPHPRRGFHTKWTLRRRGVKGQRYLYFCLSATANSSHRLFHSFSAWPASAQAPYPSFRRQRRNSLSPLRLLLPTGPASLGSGGAPLFVGQGPLYLYFWLSMTASWSHRLFHSFSAWPLTQW